jgi:hypothetical protein
MGGIAFAAVRPALGLPAIWRTFKAGALAGATPKKTPDFYVLPVMETSITLAASRYQGNHEYPKSIKPR